MDIKKLKRLGKKAIVRRAVELAKGQLFPSPFDPSREFDRVKVTLKDDGVWVYFSNPITYVPKNSAIYKDFTIQLKGDLLEPGYTSMYAAVDPGEPSKSLPACLPFPKDMNNDKAVDFVLRSMRKAGFDYISRENFPEDETMEIYERDNCYYVELIGRNVVTCFRVDKKSGRIYNKTHAHPVQSPDTNKPSVEITG